MANRVVAERYARAIFSLAQEAGAVEAVGQDLDALVRLLCDEREMRRFFESPVVDRAQKATALRAAFAGRIGTIAQNALLVLVRKRRERLLAPIAVAYREQALAAAGKTTLELESAAPLLPEEVATIVARLEARLGGSYEVRQRVDPRLLGGVRISLGDRRIDATIAGRLETLARELGAPAQR
ncbi:MAG: ATP synthase F1 subunit delta [Vulcanimicrobiaceae bacterium]